MRYLIDKHNKTVRIQGDCSFQDIEEIKTELGEDYNQFIISANQPTTGYIFPTSRGPAPDYKILKNNNPFTVAGDTMSNLVRNPYNKYTPLWKKKGI